MTSYEMALNESESRWIAAALRPRSIAVVGASENPEKIGGRPIKYMTTLGYGGVLYPINPQRPTVQGLPAYPDVESLPQAPDMAVICVPGAAALDAVRACALRGVPLAVVISSGFGETGEEGKARQDAMLAVASAHGMRLVGPNTQGLVNVGCNVVASFATLMGETPTHDGPVAIVSQSGAMSMVPYLLLRSQGIGVRHAHATGNESDLSVADFALAVACDPEIRVILLYMESVANPATLARAAAIANRRGVPILALKAGVSTRGRAAAASHTGAIASEDAVIDAFFRQHGILRIADMRSLVCSTRLMLTAPGARGLRLVAVSNSGAACVMAADAAERHGLEMEPLQPDAHAAVKELLPEFASAANPIDLTAALLTDSAMMGKVLDALGSRDACDALFLSLPMSGKGYDTPQFARDTAAFAARTQCPAMVASPLAATRAIFEQAGVPAFEHDEEAVDAMGQLLRQADLRRLALRLEALADADPEPLRLRQTIDRACDYARDTGRACGSLLSEADSLSLLAAAGIPVVEHRLCTNRAELDAALDQIPAPWVLKICSAAVPHKTELGLVKLGLREREQALAASDTLLEQTRALGIAADGVIVAPMLRAQREFIVGARWDPAFGSVVVVGDGGKYVEVMPDAVSLIFPFDIEYAVSRMQALRLAPLFDGVRGETPMPLRAIAGIAVRLGQCVHAGKGRLASVDINPLMVGPGERAVAVDALIEMAST